MKTIIQKSLAIAVVFGLTTILPVSVLANAAPQEDNSILITNDATVSSNVSAQNQSSSNQNDIPPVSGGNTGGADTNANGTGSTVIVPPVSGGNTGGADTASSFIPPVSGGSTGGADISVPTPSPVVNTSSYSGSGGGSYVGIPVLTVNPLGSTTPSNLNSCPLITAEFLKIGANNNSNQVLRLQAFLKNIEGFNVNLTGTFDADTESAVKAFQKKYLADIMGPWKATLPSGTVYITTTKKINEIACKSPITLTPAELSIISAYESRSTSPSPLITPTTSNPTVGPVVPGSVSAPTGSTSDDLIGLSNGTNNTASVANTSVFNRIWGFFKGIFGKK